MKNISSVAFAVWALLGASILFLLLGKELGLEKMTFNQVGDTSLGRNSINWIGALGLSAALLICFVLI